MIYFASVSQSYYGGWAVADDPKTALRNARRHIGATARSERCHYILEFPEGAEVTQLSELDGGWRSNVPPIRVAERSKVPAEITDNDLLGV